MSFLHFSLTPSCQDSRALLAISFAYIYQALTSKHSSICFEGYEEGLRGLLLACRLILLAAPPLHPSPRSEFWSMAMDIL